MATINSSWSTSFFYEQDLRSEYMNGILSSALRPGIYNPNMFLYTSTTGGNTNGSVRLYIRKNTTFIFSNSYDNSTGRYERSLSDVGSFLIKSTVLSDVDIELITLRQSGTITDATRNILGTGTDHPATESFYIVAIMEYDGENGDSSYSIPTFRCVVKNPEYGTSSDNKDYYYLARSKESETGNYPLPDGLTSLTAADKKVAYLILGEVRDINYTTGLYYIISNESGGQSWRENMGTTGWVTNHVFIGRGFPDYRQNYLFNKDQEGLDIVLKKQVKNTGDVLYLDAPYLSTQDLLFRKKADWRAVAGIGPYSATDISGYLSYDFTSDTTLSADVTAFSGAGVVADIFFLSTRSRYSDSDGTLVQNIFNSTNTTDEFVKNLKLTHYRWISGCAFSNLDPRYAVEGGTTIPNGYTSETGVTISSAIVPLDISSVNRDRLLTLVENRNVIPAVINYMRQNNKISPEEETSLIPALIIFRKFNSSKSYVDNVSTEKGINPSNVLSYFDLQYKTSRINNVTINAQDIYSVVPVME